MTCREVSAMLHGYALGASTAEERRVVEQHLGEGCAACRREVVELIAATTALAGSAAPHAPPARLKQELLDRVTAPEAAPTIAAALPADQDEDHKKRWARYVTAAAAALLLGSLAGWVSQKPVASNSLHENAERAEESWRRSIARAEHTLGITTASLVSVEAKPTDFSSAAQLLYDQTSQQLHLYLASVPLAHPDQTQWAWAVNAKGDITASARLVADRGPYASAVMTLKNFPIGASEILFTTESSTEPADPSSNETGRIVLIRR